MINPYILATCNNGAMDGDEEGVDCGGTCGVYCQASKYITICYNIVINVYIMNVVTTLLVK